MKHRIAVALVALSPLVYIAILAMLFSSSAGGGGAANSLEADIFRSKDEFGRNMISSLSVAVLLSLSKGLLICAVVTALALFAAYIVVFSDWSSLQIILRIACGVIESVPLILWIVIIIVSVPGPRLYVTLVAFSAIILPIVTQIILGELIRIKNSPFVKAAYLLGLSEAKVLIKYIMPALFPVILPLLIQLIGGAIAIDGAIGVLGLGSRADLDLGVFLLRGKEQFIVQPQLLLMALVAYLALYIYLKWVVRKFSNSNIYFRNIV